MSLRARLFSWHVPIPPMWCPRSASCRPIAAPCQVPASAMPDDPIQSSTGRNSERRPAGQVGWRSPPALGLAFGHVEAVDEDHVLAVVQFGVFHFP